MPQIGFSCSKAKLQPVLYETCIYKCRDRCLPLPLLLALMQERKVVENSYSVTEVLNPLQITYLQRNFPYYTLPMDGIWMGFGTGFHKFVESSEYLLKKYEMQDEHLMEEKIKFKKEFNFDPPVGKVFLKGRPDLWQPAFKRLWDFKTMKAYAVKKLKAGRWADVNYNMQMNIYRYYGFPETEEMYLEVLVKDWSEKIARMDNLQPLEKITVPFIPDDDVVTLVIDKLQELVLGQQQPTTVRQCLPGETWGGNRCKKYCSVSGICQQYQKGKIN